MKKYIFSFLVLFLAIGSSLNGSEKDTTKDIKDMRFALEKAILSMNEEEIKSLYFLGVDFSYYTKLPGCWGWPSIKYSSPLEEAILGMIRSGNENTSIIELLVSLGADPEKTGYLNLDEAINDVFKACLIDINEKTKELIKLKIEKARKSRKLEIQKQINSIDYELPKDLVNIIVDYL